MVTAGTTAHYPITFSPAKTGEKCSGGLLLTNIGTDQKFVYHLSGVGEDPHPEEVIALTAPAREIMKRTVNLNGYADNKNVDVQLMASSPLVQCRMTPAVSKSRALLGDTLHPMSTKVDVSFHALASGSYTASLSIRSKADQSLLAWYRFELTASAAPAESQLVMVTTARETVKLQIPLVNPLASTVQFDVTYQGVGLQGDSAVRLAPNAENLYTLTFTPILPLDMMGWVKFSSSTIGEFWYELHLQASEAPCQRLPPLAAHVGQCAATTVRIANPTVNDARVRIDLSNGNNFRVVPTGTDITSCMLQSRPDSMHSTVIPALCTTELMLIFWPSTLGGADEPAHRTMLEVTGDTVGKYRFEVEGSGTRPDASSQGIRMPEITARGSKGRAVVSSVIFTNPFVDQALQVMISVHDGKSSKKQSILAGGSDVDSNSPSSSDSCLFQLVPPGGVKRSFLGSTASLLGGSSSTLAAQATAPITTKHTLGPLEKHEIPFTFNATSMEQQSAELVVEAPTMGLRWIFPVIGVCEVAVTNNVHLTLMPTSSGRCGAASAHAALEARVGETLSAYVDVPLPGFVAARKGVAGAEDLDKVVLNVDVTKFTESSAALAVRNNGGGSSTGTPISSQFDLAPPLKASFLYVTGPSTTEKGTGGKLHPTARIIVRFTPKQTGQTGATVVLNDGVSKARWTVPFRMRAL